MSVFDVWSSQLAMIFLVINNIIECDFYEDRFHRYSPQWSQNVGLINVYTLNRWGKSTLKRSLKYCKNVKIGK